MATTFADRTIVTAMFSNGGSVPDPVQFITWESLCLLTAVFSDITCQSLEIRFCKELKHPEEPVLTLMGMPKDPCEEHIQKGVPRLLAWTATFGLLGGTMTYFFDAKLVPMVLGFLSGLEQNMLLAVQACMEMVFCPIYGAVMLCTTLAIEGYDIGYIVHKLKQEQFLLFSSILTTRLIADFVKTFFQLDTFSFLSIELPLLLFLSLGQDYLVHRYQPQAIPVIPSLSEPTSPTSQCSDDGDVPALSLALFDKTAEEGQLS